MIKKRDFFVIIIFLIIIFFTTSFLAETNVPNEERQVSHGFGPSLNLDEYNTNSLIIIALIGLSITMICAVLLERNISRIASKTGKNVGTTLMGLASSIPLLVIIITLTIENRGDLIISNIVSANIANLTLVLGILTLIKPLERGKSFQRGIVALTIIIASMSLIVLGISSNINLMNNASYNINRTTGYGLIGLFILFIALLNFFKSKKETHLKSKNLKKEIFLTIIFGTLVAWFANISVKAFIIIAETYSVPTIIIGSVIGVIGASLPELAIGLVCLIKKEHEEIYSNLITSNIVNFNIGIAIPAIIIGSVALNNITLGFKLPLMIFAMFVSTIFFMKKRHNKQQNTNIEKIQRLGTTRFEGILLIGLFCAWIIILTTFF